MLEIFLLIFFTLLLIHYLAFLNSIYRGLSKEKIIPQNNSFFISVIIPFRNEEENILDSLHSIESQKIDINKYEVIYVDDNSTDNSYDILCGKKSFNNISVIKAADNKHDYSHKKNAIKFGIEKSRGDIIVTTDADCTHNENWLEIIASSFNDKTGFISGPVIFNNSKSLFARIQKLEFGGLVLAGAGLIGSNSPKICNAANIAYRKNVFLEVDGFRGSNLSSGDDELLMQKIYQTKKYEVRFLFDSDAVVYTNPNKTFKDFLNQRRRWASKSIFYKDKIFVIKLILIFLFYAGILVQLFLGIFLSKLFIISFLLSVGSKLIVEYKILRKGKGIIFSEKDIKVFLPAQAFQIFYIIFASILGLFGNYTWKDRKVKR